MSHAVSGATSSNRAVRALMTEFHSIQKEPVEGFKVKLLREDNLFDWEVAIFGPPGTLYEGGYFKAHMKFPQDYPYSPPSIRFLSKIWHRNVYENGDLCISILHPPGDDPHSGELPSERWNPTQNVRTILMSVISLLNEPNTSSPANVDASVMFRRWRDSTGDNEYEQIVKSQVVQTRVEAERDGVKVPTTIEDYCVKTVVEEKKTAGPENVMDTSDFYYSDDTDEDDNYEYPDSDQDDNEDVDMTGGQGQVTNKKSHGVSHAESSASTAVPNRE